MFGPTALLVVARAMGWLEGRDGAVCVEAEKLAAVLALVFGAISWRRAVVVTRDGFKAGKAMPIAGTVLGVLAIVLGIVGASIVNDVVNDIDRCLSELTAEACSD